MLRTVKRVLGWEEDQPQSIPVTRDENEVLRGAYGQAEQQRAMNRARRWAYYKPRNLEDHSHDYSYFGD